MATELGLDELRSVPLFADLSEEALQRLAGLAAEFEVESGHVLIQPNQAGSGLFVIQEGSVDVETPGAKVTYGSGECVGELSLLTDKPRSARVRSTSHVRGLAIRRSDFQALLEGEPTFAISLLKALANKLIDTND